jgi:hypothetical protein
MNEVKLYNQNQNNVKKASDFSIDERLDMLADIIIERIFEESKNGKFPLLRNDSLKKSEL